VIEHFKPQKVFVDETGLGSPILDILKVKFPGIVEGIIFTSQSKEKMIITAHNLFEEGRLELPDRPELIEQLHGIEKIVLESGRIKYTGKRTETDWLDDRAWSLFLAVSHLGDDTFEFTIVDSDKPATLTPLERWTHDLDENGDPL